jgi:hypothetical protein
MWNPEGNKLPLCKWPDHDWQLKSYQTLEFAEQTEVYELKECSKCKRIRFIQMNKENLQ